MCGSTQGLAVVIRTKTSTSEKDTTRSRVLDGLPIYYSLESPHDHTLKSPCVTIYVIYFFEERAKFPWCEIQGAFIPKEVTSTLCILHVPLLSTFFLRTRYLRILLFSVTFVCIIFIIPQYVALVFSKRFLDWNVYLEPDSNHTMSHMVGRTLQRLDDPPIPLYPWSM
jgi:hypothetical protein